ncbi:MAG: ATP synthase F0 subunit C [Deltaproteobacteria bacterium]|nr:ATP synthase F0 subunit C [Deltaproteobacteria bacterium]
MTSKISKALFLGLLILTTLIFPAISIAEEANISSDMAKAEQSKFMALAAGLAIGVAAFGGALAQGKAVAAGLEGIARNPSANTKIFTPMLLGLAFIESLVIYALIIAFMIKP